MIGLPGSGSAPWGECPRECVGDLTLPYPSPANLVFGYKHLGLQYQEHRYRAKHAEADPDDVRERCLTRSTTFSDLEAMLDPKGDPLKSFF